MDEPQQSGVVFPLGPDGRRSTTATGRAVWADAVREVDAPLAGRIFAEGDWRKGYLARVVEVTAASTRTPDAALSVARAGLAALSERMRFSHDGVATSVPAAVAAATGPALGTHRIAGQGEPVRDLVVPYRGAQLRGDSLLRQLDTWVGAGTVEPSFAAALGRVVAEPAWLDLRDQGFAVLGAGAELGPLAPLLAWGANVLAVDLPDRRVWERLLTTAAAGAGTLELPLRPGASGTGDLAAAAGADLLTETPQIGRWLAGAAGSLPLTVGSYAYADGARHVQVAVASDAVVEHLLQTRPGRTPSWPRRPMPTPYRPTSWLRPWRGGPVAVGCGRCPEARYTPRRTRRPYAGTTGPRWASPTRSCRSRDRTTASPSACSGGVPSSRRRRAGWCRPMSRRRRAPGRSPPTGCSRRRTPGRMCSASRCSRRRPAGR